MYGTQRFFYNAHARKENAEDAQDDTSNSRSPAPPPRSMHRWSFQGRPKRLAWLLFQTRGSSHNESMCASISGCPLRGRRCGYRTASRRHILTTLQGLLVLTVTRNLGRIQTLKSCVSTSEKQWDAIEKTANKTAASEPAPCKNEHGHPQIWGQPHVKGTTASK